MWTRLVVIAEGVENRRNSGDVESVGPCAGADDSGFLGGQNAGSCTAEYSIAALIQHTVSPCEHGWVDELEESLSAFIQG